MILSINRVSGYKDQTLSAKAGKGSLPFRPFLPQCDWNHARDNVLVLPVLFMGGLLEFPAMPEPGIKWDQRLWELREATGRGPEGMPEFCTHPA